MSDQLEGFTVVFDLDGTLVNTAPDLHSALNHVLTGEGFSPVPLSAIHGMIGEGAKAMIRRGIAHQDAAPLPDERIDALWHVFVDYYAAHIDVLSHPFEHVEDVLETLQARGAILAVCTNKPQALSDQLLTTLNLAQYFPVVVGADSVPDRKPNGDHILLTINAAGGLPARSVMVGDSRTDERAARNAGLPFIFVPFGYETETVDQIGADAVISDYSELLLVLDGFS